MHLPQTAAVTFGTLAVVMACAAPAVDAASIEKLQVVTTQEHGVHLVDARGRPLYAFSKDRRATQTPAMAGCYGKCQQVWPPAYSAQVPQAGDGVNAALLGTVMRNDATLQATYNGWPLYYHARDAQGSAVPAGHEQRAHGGTWRLATPEGKVEHP